MAGIKSKGAAAATLQSAMKMIGQIALTTVAALHRAMPLTAALPDDDLTGIVDDKDRKETRAKLFASC